MSKTARSIALALLLPLLLAGCAPARPAQHVRFADVAGSGFRVDWTRPLVLEFQPGDRLPVHLALSDQLFDLSPAAPPLELVAKRRGFVRIEPGQVSASLTGDDFDTKPLAPGTFNFGISVTRQGTWLALAVTTPRHAEPTREAQR
jgi:hypothetical protein